MTESKSYFRAARFYALFALVFLVADWPFCMAVCVVLVVIMGIQGAREQDYELSRALAGEFPLPDGGTLKIVDGPPPPLQGRDLGDETEWQRVRPSPALPWESLAEPDRKVIAQILDEAKGRPRE